MFDKELQNFWRKIIIQATQDACQTNTINRLQKKLDKHCRTKIKYKNYEKTKALLQLALSNAISDRQDAIIWLLSEDFQAAASISNYCVHAKFNEIKKKHKIPPTP